MSDVDHHFALEAIQALVSCLPSNILRIFVLTSGICALTPIIIFSSSCGAQHFDDSSIAKRWNNSAESEENDPDSYTSTDSDSSQSPSALSQLRFTSIPLGTKFLLAPFNRSWTGFMAVQVENQSEQAFRLEQAEVIFDSACDVIGQVALAVTGAVASDTLCSNRVRFTVDTELPPGAQALFEFRAFPRNDLEGLLNAYRRQKSSQTFTISLTKFETATSGTLVVSALSAPIQVAFPTCREMRDARDDLDCAEAEDAGSFAFDFCAQNESLRVVRNDHFLLPFRAGVSALLDLPTLGDIEVSFDWDSSAPLTILPVALFVDGSLSSGTVSCQADQHLQILLPEDELLEGASAYSILARAPNYRGALTFKLESGNISLPEEVALAGCYPQFSETLLILPSNEWEEIMEGN